MRILNKCDRNKVDWTVRKLISNYDNKIITYDNAVQRGYEWKSDKQSEFILSIILEKPIPPIYVTRGEDGDYSAIDGKQRCMTLHKYINDEFALSGLKPVEVEDDNGDIIEMDINDKYFSEQEDIIRNAIMDSSLTIEIINNPTEEEVCDYFYLLNNGKPLSAMTKSRVRAVSMKKITEIGSHELFKSALTSKALERYANEDIVVKSWAILNEEEPVLDATPIRKLMESVEIQDEEAKQLNLCFDRIFRVYNIIEDKKIAKRIITKTHMISIMRIVNESIKKNQSEEDFEKWFVYFFSGRRSATISDAYNSAARSGVGRKDSVRRRLDELQRSYDGYFGGRENAA